MYIVVDCCTSVVDSRTIVVDCRATPEKLSSFNLPLSLPSWQNHERAWNECFDWLIMKCSNSFHALASCCVFTRTMLNQAQVQGKVLIPVLVLASLFFLCQRCFHGEIRALVFVLVSSLVISSLVKNKPKNTIYFGAQSANVAKTSGNIRRYQAILAIFDKKLGIR